MNKHSFLSLSLSGAEYMWHDWSLQNLSLSAHCPGVLSRGEWSRPDQATVMCRGASAGVGGQEMGVAHMAGKHMLLHRGCKVTQQSFVWTCPWPRPGQGDWPPKHHMFIIRSDSSASAYTTASKALRPAWYNDSPPPITYTHHHSVSPTAVKWHSPILQPFQPPLWSIF